MGSELVPLHPFRPSLFCGQSTTLNTASLTTSLAAFRGYLQGEGCEVCGSVGRRALRCSEHPSLLLAPWHVQILNCVASLTDHLSQGPRGISRSCPDLGAQPQPLQAQPVEGPPPA